MVVVETKLEGFNNKLSYAKLNYPQCMCGKCPRFYWNMMNIGARGSGKTYTICQMIKHYEKNKIMKDGVKYKLRTHLISPTIQANEIYQSLDSLDMDKDAHENYSDKLLLSIIADIKDKKEKYEDHQLYKKYYEKVMKIPESKIEKAYDDNPYGFVRHYNRERCITLLRVPKFKIFGSRSTIFTIIIKCGTDAITARPSNVLVSSIVI